MARPQVSVVIPAFNEERRLGPSLDRVSAYFRKRHLPHEILVCDDGSLDGTAALVRAAARRLRGLRLISLGVNRGKGQAVRRGVEEARGRYILMSDADLSTPVEEYEALAAALRRGAHVAVGSRALDRTRVTVRQPLYRDLAGRVFNLAVRAFTLQGFADTQCGFKLFEARAAKRIFALQRIPRFGFDVEVLYLARKLGYSIAEIPVRWANSPETKVRPFRDGVRTFLDLWLIRWHDWAGHYDG